MAIVSLNKKELKKIIGNISDERIDEILSMFSTPIEQTTEETIEVEVAPNRPDMLSQQGLQRGLSAFLGKKTGLKEYRAEKSGYKLMVEKSLPKEWPYAFACIVKGLKFDDEKIKEVIAIQEKLDSTLLRDRKKGGIGIYPLEKISFPIRFIGMNPDEIKFRPLEYPQEITGKQILSKHSTGRKYAHICQDWSKFPVFVDDKEVIMSMPPIINSHDVGKIDETTKDVFVEVTGNDFFTIEKALTIIVTALADMGGEIYSIDCMQQNKKKTSIPNLTPEKMKISLEDINKLLGLELKEKQVKKLLEKMGYNFNVKNKEAEIPAWRTDILHPVDIYEDVAIAYGYSNFLPEVPSIATIGEEDKKEIKKRKISEILTGLNMLEISTHHLLTKDDFKKTGLKEKIEVEESKTDYSILRQNLIPSVLKVLSENIDSEYPQKIFEIGRIFEKYNKGDVDKKNLGSYYEETGIKEIEKLAIALTPSNFTELKQILEYLARMLEIEFKIQETSEQNFIEGRTGKIMFKDKEIGILGEIHPSLLKTFHLKMNLCYLELSLDDILKS